MTFGALVCSRISTVTAAPVTSGAPIDTEFAIRHQKDLFEFGIGPRLEGKLFNLDDVTFCDAVLLATGLYHCVCHEFVSSVGTCENPTPPLLQQAKFFPCAGVRERQTSAFCSARVVKWQTRTFEGRMPKGMGVQVPPRALLKSWS